jgi:hypothetical protein
VHPLKHPQWEGVPSTKRSVACRLCNLSAMFCDCVDGVRWCAMVRDGARWCAMVRDGARQCAMVRDGVRWSAIGCAI